MTALCGPMLNELINRSYEPQLSYIPNLIRVIVLCIWAADYAGLVFLIVKWIREIGQ